MPVPVRHASTNRSRRLRRPAFRVAPRDSAERTVSPLGSWATRRRPPRGRTSIALPAHGTVSAQLTRVRDPEGGTFGAASRVVVSPLTQAAGCAMLARRESERRAGSHRRDGGADMIERRPFGRTGHSSTVTLFGAAALARVSQDEADRALEVLLRYGVNHIDTAARYGDSELRIGPWMARHRRDFFLATKTGSRSAEAA